MHAAVVGMLLVALLAFASDRAHGQPNPFQQQQPRRGLDNLLDDNQGITGPAQAVVPAANQLDVPAEAELKDADKQIKTAYEADYKGNPKLLAEKLNAAADETKEKDDPAFKYVLLLESQEAFMRAGDVDNAVELLNARGGLFKINMPAEKLKLIKEFPKPAGAIGKKLIDLSLKMTDEALEADQVEIAEDAVELALALARKSAGPDRLKTCALERTRVKERRAAFDECQTALAALKKNPADQEANSVVGRYYSIDKHDWEKGLPYLIQGKQDSLQANATREQTLRQNKVPADNTIEQMFLLAGDWWTLSEGTKGKDEKLAIGIKTHASDLYAELLPNLTRPVDKELAKTRGADGRNMVVNKPDKGRSKVGNILINSDFEDELSGWEPRGAAVAIQSPKDAHSGNYFCQLEGRGYVGVYQNVTVSPGATLVLQMWIDVGFEGNEPSQFEVWSDRECVAAGKFRIVKTVGRWRLVTTQVRLPQLLSKETLRVGVALYNPKGAAVRVDDCELTCTP